MWISALVTLLVVHQASSWDWPTPWNTLKVTFGAKLLTAKEPFHKMPLTVEEAKKNGYVPVDDGSCSGLFTGVRYYNPTDPVVSLLYDVGENVVGIQANFKIASLTGKGVADWFAQGNMYIKNTIKGEDFYTVTAYLTDQAIICTTGRTAEQVKAAPSGDQLSFQTKDELLKIPLQQKDVDKVVWTEGKCFPLMGLHYWYDISKDMDCNNFKPVFLLVNQGHVTGFGLTAIAMQEESIRFEHPQCGLFEEFMQEVPECLLQRCNELGGVTTMHVYMNFNILTETCLF